MKHVVIGVLLAALLLLLFALWCVVDQRSLGIGNVPYEGIFHGE